jgi:hypothetical protein
MQNNFICRITITRYNKKLSFGLSDFPDFRTPLEQKSPSADAKRAFAKNKLIAQITPSRLP